MDARKSTSPRRLELELESRGELRLTEWHLRNFKSVEEAHISLRPLTVLLGPNSAGKSSLIQSILIYVQAQSSFERSDLVSLNGSLIKLGAYDEVRTKGGATRPTGGIKIGGVLEPWRVLPSSTREAAPRSPSSARGPLAARYEWGASFGRLDNESSGRMRVNECWLQTETRIGRLLRDSPSGADLPVAEVDVARLELKRKQRVAASGSTSPVFMRSGRRSPLTASVDFEMIGAYRGTLSRSSEGQRARRVTIAAGTPQSGLPGVAFKEESLGEVLLADWDRLLAVRARHMRGLESDRRVGDLETAARTVARDVIVWWEQQQSSSESRWMDRMVLPARALLHATSHDILAQLTEEDAPAFRKSFLAELADRGLGDERVLVDVSEEGVHSDARDVIARYLATMVHYLGPIRTTARAVASEAQYSRGVGVEGEITAAALHGDWDRPTLYRRPADDDSDRGVGDLAEAPMGVAVNDWMRALELVDNVEAQDQGRYGLEVVVTPRGVDAKLNLRNVGVGISQILPLVVLCLRSRPGSLILVEQPELHLHPAAQQRLADFLVAMIQSGRQIIVETHSDHLVARLRRRIAEDANDELMDEVGFVYVTRDEVTGRTEYQQATANKYGGLEGWPQGFFDQGPREAAETIRVALEKKRRQDGQVADTD